MQDKKKIICCLTIIDGLALKDLKPFLSGISIEHKCNCAGYTIKLALRFYLVCHWLSIKSFLIVFGELL